MDPLLATIDSAAADDSFEVYRLAESIFAECKEVVQLSSLNTSIFLLRTALAHYPPSHALRSSTVVQLANALLTRFWKTGHPLNVQVASFLWVEALTGQRPVNIDDFLGGEPPESDQITDEEAFGMVQLALSTLFDIHQSVDLASLSTAITLYYEAVSSTATQPGVATSLAAALCCRYRHTDEAKDLIDAIELYREGLHRQPSSHPSQLPIMISLSAALLDLSISRKESALLKEAISIGSEFSTLSQTFAWQALPFFQSAEVSFHKLDDSSDITDLNNIFSIYTKALSLLPVGDLDGNRSKALQRLADVLCMRYRRNNCLPDLDKAIAYYQEAYQLSEFVHSTSDFEYFDLRPPCPRQCALLCNFAEALHLQAERTGHLSNLNEAIALLRRSIELQDACHHDGGRSLSSIASAIVERTRHTGHHSDLEEAVALYRESLKLQPRSAPGQLVSLNGLSSTFHLRYELAGQPSDLDNGIALLRNALGNVHPTHPKRPILLINLANQLRLQPHTLNEAISIFREVLEHQDCSQFEQWAVFNNLAVALHEKFDATPGFTTLDEVVLLFRKALDLLPPTDRRRLIPLQGLANALEHRFQETNQLSDLDEAILFVREALLLRPKHDQEQQMPLHTLAIALSTRFYITHQLADMDDAIILLREELDLLSPSNPRRLLALDELGILLNDRCTHTGQKSDLEQSITFHREALRLSPNDHYARSSFLVHTAGSLFQRFGWGILPDDFHHNISGRSFFKLTDGNGMLQKLAGDGFLRQARTDDQFADLDEAITLLQEATSLFPVGHQNRLGSLTRLTMCLHTRFIFQERQTDLKSALEASQNCADELSMDHPRSCLFLQNRGSFLVGVFSETKQSGILDEAMEAFRQAATCMSAGIWRRFDAMCTWARFADLFKHESASDAYKLGVESLPRLAMVGTDIRLRKEMLIQADGFARNAAAHAISCCQLEKAIEFLEAGRGVFWSQALHLRTPLDGLQEKAPTLANRFRAISMALEKNSELASASQTLREKQQKREASTDQIALNYRRLYQEWHSVIDEIRGLDGFEDFIRPTSFDKLQKAAPNGYVVFLNVSTNGSSALVMTPSGVEHIPLPLLTVPLVNTLVQLVQYASFAARSLLPKPLAALFNSSGQGTMHPAIESLFLENGQPTRYGQTQALKTTNSPDSDQIFRAVLGTAWVTIAEPIIRLLNTGSEGNCTSPPLKRIWWCPTGPLTFIPIHAAGLYNENTEENTFKYAISSYALTLGTLRPFTPASNVQFKMLAVATPDTLPCTSDELGKIKSHAGDSIFVLGTSDHPASVDHVLSHLPSASVVHFACHGRQHRQNPLESALILNDGELSVSTIMQQALPNASLAFLSACETAMGDETLSDEAMHLAATLLFAGFHGVVGTMWKIADEDGPVIADSFYEVLFETYHHASVNTNAPDTTQAAKSLHTAVQKLQAQLGYNKSFRRWVPFVYYGL